MKNLTAIQPQLNQQYASEPYIILEIVWANNDVRRYTIKDRLLEINDLTSVQSAFGLSQIATASVSISDPRGEERTRAEQQGLEGRICRLIQAFEKSENTALLYEGVAEGPIRWEEATGIFSFDIVSKAKNLKVGTILTQSRLNEFLATYPNIDVDKMLNSTIPICYGAVVKMEPLKLTQQYIARLASRLIINNPWVQFPDPVNSTFIDLDNDEVFILGKDPATVTALEIEGRIIYVNYSGLIDNRHRYAITNINPRKYLTAIGTGTRPTDDPDYNNPYVLWLARDGFNLVGNMCAINQANMFATCVRQEGRKCWFNVPWTTRETYTGAFPGGQFGTVTKRTKLLIFNTSPIIEVRAFAPDDNFQTYDRYAESNQIVIEPGAEVRVWDVTRLLGLYPEVYLVSDLLNEDTPFRPARIVSVQSNHSQTNRLEEVPFESVFNTYYLPKRFESQNINCLFLECQIPISDFNSLYSDQLYVSLRSTTEVSTIDGTINPNEPWGNPVAIIKHIIENWSSYNVGSSFTQAAIDVANYPCGFAIYESIGLFELIADIAYQTRCVLSVHGNTIEINYLSKVPSSPVEIKDSRTLSQSYNLTFTPLTDIVTAYTYTYQLSRDRQERSVTLYRNDEEFGIKEARDSFWIFNNLKCVEASAEFWAFRRAYPWRELDVTTDIEYLRLDISDSVSIDTNSLFGSRTSMTGVVRGLVKGSRYNILEKTIGLSVQLASAMGSNVENPNYWTVKSFTRPLNPCSTNRRRYNPIYMKEIVEDHSLLRHVDVNDKSRIRKFGGLEQNTTGLQDNDLLAWNTENQAWTPVNATDLTTNAGGGGGGGDTIFEPYVGITNSFFTRST